MAPAKRYIDPHEQLVDSLRTSRYAGLSFAAAWTLALRPGERAVMATATDPPSGAIRWPTDTTERIAWKTAIVDSRDVYRRAYEQRAPTHRERAVVTLMHVLDRAGALHGIPAGDAVRSAA